MGNNALVKQIFLMMGEKRVDLYADNELVLQHMLNKLNLHDKFKIVPPA